ncbi:GNAT family N-acetyltransferase [Paraburkholderia diazotrophica]|uniref:GNAT family N-acetyltransferase n=1 Tax=Paraburkholderia diazotrophica TaxID=667676 RepID=UPI003175B641
MVSNVQDALVVRSAVLEDADSLSRVAIAAVPFSCPPDTTEEALSAFVRENLQPEHFIEHMTASARTLLVAECAGRIAGFSLLYDEDVPDCVPGASPIELRRIYVHADYHGAGVGLSLMDASIGHARSLGRDFIWLGVSESNERAQRFYAKNRFVKVGEHFFQVGHEQQLDYLLAKPVDTPMSQVSE